MSNLKIKAMGRDLVHNQMLKNLSEDNKKHLLNLFNTMLTSSYVRPTGNKPLSSQFENTYAVFLYVSKAFNTTWIPGLLFKLSNKGVNGCILG